MVRLKDICDVDWGDTNLTKQSYVEDGKYLGVSAGGCDGRMEYYDFDAVEEIIAFYKTLVINNVAKEVFNVFCTLFVLFLSFSQQFFSIHRSSLCFLSIYAKFGL